MLGILQFARKIAGGLLYESKPIDRPVSWPSKRKSLDDITEEKGRCVVILIPRNCSTTSTYISR